ncbi:MAG: ATP-binding protein [Verrucomicrobium sp.]|nr:ATP-binding protein [Verrucomicrobium sp.]
MSEAIQTQWVIITGAPSSGKTSLLTALESQGHRTAPEAARAYFEQKLSSGSTLDELLGWEYSKLGLEINEFEESTRAHLPKDERVFLDRVAAIESLAYAEVRGAVTNDALREWPSKYRHHGTVFILDPLPVKKDGIRSEDDEQARALDKAFEKYYKHFGYDVVRVPAYPLDPQEASLERQIAKSVGQRLDFMLARLEAVAAVSEAEDAVTKRAALIELQNASAKGAQAGSRPAGESDQSKAR